MEKANYNKKRCKRNYRCTDKITLCFVFFFFFIFIIVHIHFAGRTFSLLLWIYRHLTIASFLCIKMEILSHSSFSFLLLFISRFAISSHCRYLIHRPKKKRKKHIHILGAKYREWRKNEIFFYTFQQRNKMNKKNRRRKKHRINSVLVMVRLVLVLDVSSPLSIFFLISVKTIIYVSYSICLILLYTVIVATSSCILPPLFAYTV